MSQSENHKNENDAFEFPLLDVPEREPLYTDAVTEFFRQQILNLLDVVVLTTNCEPAKIDGFAFLKNPNESYALWSSKN
jgi:hypothetical protein